MAILGVLSLFQAWVLPGFLFLLLYKKIKIIDNFVLSIPLSLVLNYILIYILVFFNLYNQILLLIIIFFELIFIIYLLVRNYNFSKLINEIDNFFSIKSRNNLINVEFSFLNLIIFFLLIVYSFYALKNLGQPVHGGDPLDMWNEWAISWSKNIIPTGVEYPQVVPILYSISYVLISNYDVEYFTSAVCLIYPIWIFVIFFRLTYLFPENKTLIKLSLIVTTFFLLSILRNYSLFVGYSDPILVLATTGACFIFFYFFVQNQNKYEMNFKDIILISLIASAPAITKQMGLLVSFIFPIFYLINNYYKKKINFKNFILISLIIFIIITSWYIFPILEYSKINFESTKFGRLSSSAMSGLQEVNFFTKLDYGLEYLFWKFKYLILILILLSFNNKYALLVFLLIVLPYFLIWSLFFVADNRNFVMVSPFVGFILSVGIINLFQFFSLILNKYFKAFKIVSILLFSTLLLFSIQKIKNNEKLIFKSIESKKLRGYPEINVLLYNSLKSSSPNHKIVTISDSVFVHLPSIGDKFIRTSCDKFINLVENKFKNQDYYFLLNTNYCDLESLIKNEQYFLKIDKIFDHKNHQLYFITN
tara:strand:- start:2515 stop:4287 length:1773 start_codon:yes stop_codon:yes gene_type:complete